MVSNDILVRKKWVEWGRFHKEWADRSFEDCEKWMNYKSELVPEVISTGVKWNVFVDHEEERTISFTKQFRAYYKPIMRFLLEANEKILESYDYKPVEAFIEYGFVQIISKVYRNRR
jgi:hypothetical protein